MTRVRCAVGHRYDCNLHRVWQGHYPRQSPQLCDGGDHIGNNVTLNDTNALVLGASTIGGNLSVTATQSVTQSGALSVTGTTTVATNAAKNIDLSKASNNFSTVEITSANNVSLRDANAIDLGASTVSGTLSVTAGEAITDSGALSVTNTATFGTAADKNIALDNANNFSTVVVTQAKDVTLNDTNAIVLGGSSIGNDLTVTAGGAISDSGASTIGGAATFTASGKNIVLDDVHDFATVAIGAGNNVTLNDTNAIVLGASTIAGTLNVTAAGNITSSGALDVTGDATFTAGSATGQSIILSKAGNTFDGTVTFAQSSKTLDAITFVNDIAGSTDYTLPAKVVNLTLTQNGTASGVELETVNVTNDLTVTATGNVTQSGALTVGNTATIATATTANVVLTKATNAFNTVAVTQAKDVTLTDTNAIVLGASTVSGSLTVTAGEAITDSGALSVTNTATFETAADKNITLDNANNFNKVVVTKANDVNLNDTSAIVLGASTISGDFSVTAAEAVTQSGALSVTNGTTTIATNAAKNVDLSKASNDFATVGITSANDVSLQDANAIDLAASTVSGGLAVTAGGDISDSGALTITGATVLNTPGNNVVLDEAANDFSSIQITSGAAATIVDQNQLTVNASTLTTSSSFSSSDIDIGGTLTGAGTLTLNANASATSYGVGDATGNDYTVSSADLNNLVGWSNIDFTSAGNVPIEVAGTIDPSNSADLQFTGSVLNVENTATIGGGVSNLVTVNAPTITGSNGVTTGNLTVSRNLTFTGGTISLNSLVTNQAVTLGSHSH